jgi:7-cyano-7-deazaguanine synthase
MKAVVIYSGGMDSFTLVNSLARDKSIDELHAISFDYGQKHDRELFRARAVCEELKIPHYVIQLPIPGKSALTTPAEVPEGHYAAPNMRETVVPNRNMVMLSIAAQHAYTLDADALFYGAHSGDHAIYPDCRKEFVDAMNQAVNIGNYTSLAIIAPYIDLTKGDIVKIGLELGLDYSKSYTCYNGRVRPCGKCGACTERLEAFQQNNVKDPLEYE